MIPDGLALRIEGNLCSILLLIVSRAHRSFDAPSDYAIVVLTRSAADGTCSCEVYSIFSI